MCESVYSRVTVYPCRVSHFSTRGCREESWGVGRSRGRDAQVESRGWGGWREDWVLTSGVTSSFYPRRNTDHDKDPGCDEKTLDLRGSWTTGFPTRLLDPGNLVLRTPSGASSTSSTVDRLDPRSEPRPERWSEDLARHVDPGGRTPSNREPRVRTGSSPLGRNEGCKVKSVRRPPAGVSGLCPGHEPPTSLR